jgi:hypothetical protein
MPAAAPHWFHDTPKPDKTVRPSGKNTSATDPCRCWACHRLVGRPADPDSTNPSRCGRNGGVPPAQLPPAAPPAIRQAHRPLPLGPGGSSSLPWLATAGPAPLPTARCRAPDTAGRRGCRTAARSCGKPGSANRRSAGCTDRGRRAWASRCRCGPCRSPSRAGWRSPRAGGSSGRSRGVTALGLVARLRPTHQAGEHGHVGAASRFHRTPHRSGWPGTVSMRLATQSRNGHPNRHHGALDRLVMSRPKCGVLIGHDHDDTAAAVRPST